AARALAMQALSRGWAEVCAGRTPPAILQAEIRTSGSSPGKAIRGGIPIIFPWFGPNQHARAAPQHGFARTTPWHLDGVETAGCEALTLTLSLGDVGSPFWPEPFRAIYRATFARTLSLRLAVQNRGSHPITFEEALHSYFAVSDVTAVAIAGLAG